MIRTRMFAAALLAVLASWSVAPAAERISGTVRASSNSAALEGIDIDVLDAVSGAVVAITGGTSAANGTYTLTLPGPGSYLVRADPTADDGYASQYYNGAFLKSLAQTVTVGAGATVTGVDFLLPTGVSISGRVSSGATGLVGIDIDVYSSGGEFLATYPATTGTNGTYTVGALPPGTYFLAADPDITLDSQLYVKAFHGGAPDLATATPVVVGASPVTNINLALTAGGTIRGTIRDMLTSVPLADIDLDVFDSGGVRVNAQAKTDPDGAFEIGALAPGVYLLRADPSPAQGFARTYYPNTPSDSGATPIGVATGVRTSNVDFSLATGGRILGTVRRASDAMPLAGVDLDLFGSAGQFLGAYTATTDASGNYRFGPLMAGTYLVRADPDAVSGLAEQFHNGKIDVGTADPVTVTAGADTTTIDFSLEEAGNLDGTVRTTGGAPLAGIDIDLYDSAGRRLRKSADSAVDGSWTITSLPPGDYLVRADPDPIQGYARVYFDAHLTRATADPVPVTGAATTTGIDFALPEAATLAGSVLDDNGGPVPNVLVELQQSVGGLTIETRDSTDFSGAFLLESVPPGDYLLRAVPDPGLSSPWYYGDTTEAGSATVVSLAAGQNLSGADITIVGLQPGPQSDAQQACITTLNEDFAKVAKAESREVLGCLKSRAGGSLAGTLDDCFVADPKTKVARAFAKTETDESARCLADPPDFGATDAFTINDTGLSGEVALVQAVFGPTVEAAIFPSSAGALSKCQLSVVKQLQKCRLTRIGTFNRCKQAALSSGEATLPGSLEACFVSDPTGKVAGSCDPDTGKLGNAVRSKCAVAAADLAPAFPACESATAGDLADCLAREEACRTCLDLDIADGLDGDCDALDDGLANATCP